MPSSNYLLLDAVIVILAYQANVWTRLKRRHRVAVPATVSVEARFARSESGPAPIHLQREADCGEIDCLDATADELLRAVSDFVPSFVEGLHGGELEALALLYGGRFPDYLFCTADVPAIEAAAMLGLGSRLISWEDLLRALGALPSRPLPRFLRTETLQRHTRIGETRRVTGEYFLPGRPLWRV